MPKKKEDLEAAVGVTAEENANAAVSEVAETDDLNGHLYYFRRTVI